MVVNFCQSVVFPYWFTNVVVLALRHVKSAPLRKLVEHMLVQGKKMKAEIVNIPIPQFMMELHPGKPVVSGKCRK